jgi:toluene monooxygenase system protein D
MLGNTEKRDWVGPVLAAGPLAEAVVAAIREVHPEAEVVDRGAYLRVQVPGRCRLLRAAVERRTGEPFRLPSDLESVMSSFKGRLSVSEDEATWELGTTATAAEAERSGPR